MDSEISSSTTTIKTTDNNKEMSDTDSTIPTEPLVKRIKDNDHVVVSVETAKVPLVSLQDDEQDKNNSNSTTTTLLNQEPLVVLPPPVKDPCIICHIAAKYTCPGCKLRTCSLVCVNEHKKRYDCNGKLKASVYIPKSQLNEDTLMQDLKLITQVESTLKEKSQFKTLANQNVSLTDPTTLVNGGGGKNNNNNNNRNTKSNTATKRANPAISGTTANDISADALTSQNTQQEQSVQQYIKFCQDILKIKTLPSLQGHSSYIQNQSYIYTLGTHGIRLNNNKYWSGLLNSSQEQLQQSQLITATTTPNNNIPQTIQPHINNNNNTLPLFPQSSIVYFTTALYIPKPQYYQNNTNILQCIKSLITTTTKYILPYPIPSCIPMQILLTSFFTDLRITNIPPQQNNNNKDKKQDQRSTNENNNATTNNIDVNSPLSKLLCNKCQFVSTPNIKTPDKTNEKSNNKRNNKPRSKVKKLNNKDNTSNDINTANNSTNNNNNDKNDNNNNTNTNNDDNNIIDNVNTAAGSISKSITTLNQSVDSTNVVDVNASTTPRVFEVKNIKPLQQVHVEDNIFGISDISTLEHEQNKVIDHHHHHQQQQQQQQEEQQENNNATNHTNEVVQDTNDITKMENQSQLDNTPKTLPTANSMNDDEVPTVVSSTEEIIIPQDVKSKTSVTNNNNNNNDNSNTVTTNNNNNNKDETTNQATPQEDIARFDLDIINLTYIQKPVLLHQDLNIAKLLHSQNNSATHGNCLCSHLQQNQRKEEEEQQQSQYDAFDTVIYDTQSESTTNTNTQNIASNNEQQEEQQNQSISQVVKFYNKYHAIQPVYLLIKLLSPSNNPKFVDCPLTLSLAVCLSQITNDFGDSCVIIDYPCFLTVTAAQREILWQNGHIQYIAGVKTIKDNFKEQTQDCLEIAVNSGNTENNNNNKMSDDFQDSVTTTTTTTTVGNSTNTIEQNQHHQQTQYQRQRNNMNTSSTKNNIQHNPFFVTQNQEMLGELLLENDIRLQALRHRAYDNQRPTAHLIPAMELDDTAIDRTNQALGSKRGEDDYDGEDDEEGNLFDEGQSDADLLLEDDYDDDDDDDDGTGVFGKQLDGLMFDGVDEQFDDEIEALLKAYGADATGDGTFTLDIS